MRVEIHMHDDSRDREIDILEELLEITRTINRRVRLMSAELDRLKSSVAALKTVDDSIIALVQQLAQMFRDAAPDNQAIAVVADDVDAEAARLSAAVQANTPPPPPPPPVP